jgi:rare lipoprotein A
VCRLISVLVLVLVFVSVAEAGRWRTSVASWYGPVMYGNRTACGHRLTSGSTWVAHKSLPCGTRIVVCRRQRCRTSYVGDRGSYVRGRTLDLAAGLASALRFSGDELVRWRRLLDVDNTEEVPHMTQMEDYYRQQLNAERAENAGLRKTIARLTEENELLRRGEAKAEQLKQHIDHELIGLRAGGEKMRVSVERLMRLPLDAVASHEGLAGFFEDLHEDSGARAVGSGHERLKHDR